MNPHFLLDAEMFPPFEGFPKEGLKFFRQLKKNNTREWFGKNKEMYEEFVKIPMQSFVASLKIPLGSVAPEIEVNPKHSIFRIHRDTRFSNDKTPYKTHVAAVFKVKGHRWQESAGFYVGITPGRIDVGGGIYMPSTQQLKRIRAAMEMRSDEFSEIVQNPKFKKRFGGLMGEKLVRPPRGFGADHPMIEWLKYKQFYAGVEWSEAACYTSKFVDMVATTYKELIPLIRFLNSALKIS